MALCHLSDGRQRAALGSCQATEAAADALEVATRATPLQLPLHSTTRRNVVATRRTTAHGYRRLHLRGSGRVSSRSSQRSDRSRRHSSEDALPTLGLPVLAGASGEVVDSSALSFLTAQALEAKGKEEEEEEEQEAKRRKTHAAEEAARLELRSLLAVPRSRRTAEHESRLNAATQLLGAASKRKRKKRKKRKKRRLPRVPLLGGRRLCDHAAPVPAVQGVREYDGSQIQFIGIVLNLPGTPQRQVRTVLTCADYWRLHRCSAWERLLTHPLWCNDRCRVVQTVLVDNGTGTFRAGFAGYSHFLLCSFRLSARP